MSALEEASSSSATRVIITLSARDLRDADIDSVSDPFCVVNDVAGNGKMKQWKEIGKTEVINNCLDPEWSTKITMDYYANSDQRLRLVVLDKGPKVQQKTTDKVLGAATTVLQDVVSAPMHRITLPLYYEGKQYGTITIVAEPMRNGRQDTLYISCNATRLDKKDFLGKCDPFLKISRINYDNTLHLALRTRYKEQTLNPKWKAFEILLDQLCYGDQDREFLIECFDWDQDGNHDLVGACTTTVNRLLNKVDISLQLINPKKAKKSKKYTDSGMLHFQKVYCWHDYSFRDFINTGTHLEFTVAVAFPEQWDTRPGHNKQYAIALSIAAEIFDMCGYHEPFYAYGLNGQLPHSDKYSAVFSLNVETNQPQCPNVRTLLTSFQHAQRNVHLVEQQQFAPIMKMAARHASSLPSDGSRYSVLIIITDGQISDLDRTKQEIVKASGLPLSIIILGVGYDSFEEMYTLDSDNHILSSNGKTARRDIVQFTQLRAYLPPHKRMCEVEELEARRELAKEVLDELPHQLTSYMKSNGISPRVSLPPEGRPSPRLHHQPLRPTLSADGMNRPRRLLPAVPTQELHQLRL